MEAYRHQVGGHSRLMKPQDSSKVYKPYSESEFRFYEKLSSLGSTATDSGPLHVLKQFVPKYFGVTEVQLQTTCMPPVHFPPGTRTPAPSASLSSSQGKLSATANSVGTSIAGKAENVADCLVDAKTIPLSSSSTKSTTETAQQPSSSSCQSSSVLKYIVLEDLVYMYKKPCVMDIKMGKRQRKIGASPEKEQRQLEKSLKTTSHAVGFRLCGCQFYDKKNGILCYRDKYWGRKLTKDKLLQSIGQWFWNGYVVYHELLLPLISSLRILYSCISELRHYRFWSSSLLWVFDGGLMDASGRLRSLDVRLIDFANTIVLKDNPAPDDEYLFGLGNLISILESLAFSPTTTPSTIPRESRQSMSPTKQIGSRPSAAVLNDIFVSSTSHLTDEDDQCHSDNSDNSDNNDNKTTDRVEQQWLDGDLSQSGSESPSLSSFNASQIPDSQNFVHPQELLCDTSRKMKKKLGRRLKRKQHLEISIPSTQQVSGGQSVAQTSTSVTFQSTNAPFRHSALLFPVSSCNSSSFYKRPLRSASRRHSFRVTLKAESFSQPTDDLSLRQYHLMRCLPTDGHSGKIRSLSVPHTFPNEMSTTTTTHWRGYHNKTDAFKRNGTIWSPTTVPPTHVPTERQTKWKRLKKKGYGRMPSIDYSLSDDYDEGCGADGEESDDEGSITDAVAGKTEGACDISNLKCHSKREKSFDISTTAATNIQTIVEGKFSAEMAVQPFTKYEKYEPGPSKKIRRRRGNMSSARRRKHIQADANNTFINQDDLTRTSFHRKCLSAPSLALLANSPITPRRGKMTSTQNHDRSISTLCLPEPQPESDFSAKEGGTIFQKDQMMVQDYTERSGDSQKASITFAKKKKELTRHGHNALGAFRLPATVALQLGRSDLGSSESYSTSSEDFKNQGDIDSDQKKGHLRRARAHS